MPPRTWRLLEVLEVLEALAEQGPRLVADPDGLAEHDHRVAELLARGAGLDRLEVLDPIEGPGEAVGDLVQGDRVVGDAPDLTSRDQLWPRPVPARAASWRRTSVRSGHAISASPAVPGPLEWTVAATATGLDSPERHPPSAAGRGERSSRSSSTRPAFRMRRPPRASPSEPRSTRSCKDYGRGSTSGSPGPASTGDLRVGGRGLDARVPRVGSHRDDPEAYRVEGDPRVEVFQVVSVLCARTRHRTDELSHRVAAFVRSGTAAPGRIGSAPVGTRAPASAWHGERMVANAPNAT